MYFPKWDLHVDRFRRIVRIAQVPLLPATDASDMATRHPRGRHDSTDAVRRRDTAVNAIQATLGEALLLLGSLALVLFALILLLLEAKVIVCLGNQLNRDLRMIGPPPAARPPASNDRHANHRSANDRSAPGPEPEERREDAAS